MNQVEHFEVVAMPHSEKPHWTLEDIAFDHAQRDRVVADDRLFYQITAASFIEITSDLYTGNLVTYFEGDEEVTDWLKNQWEPEELQHGAALRRYVETVWPDFDWERAYRAFHTEYAATCRMEALEPTRTRELVARCVVEMGTATAYRSLESMTGEPVLKKLAGHIKTDEVRHYKHFYRFFRRYRNTEKVGRLPIARTLYERLGTFDTEDTFIALKHVSLEANPGRPFTRKAYEQFRQETFRLARDHYPYEMGVKMLLRPLELGHFTQRAMVPLLSVGAKHILMH